MAVVGSRDFPRPNLVRNFIYTLTQGDVVVSGGARGVDRLAETVALSRGMKVRVIKPDVVGIPAYGEEGYKQAYSARAKERNQKIVDDSDQVVAFWDGVSPGTRDTIARARLAGKMVTVVYPDGKKETVAGVGCGG